MQLSQPLPRPIIRPLQRRRPKIGILGPEPPAAGMGLHLEPRAADTDPLEQPRAADTGLLTELEARAAGMDLLLAPRVAGMDQLALEPPLAADTGPQGLERPRAAGTDPLVRAAPRNKTDGLLSNIPSLVLVLLQILMSTSTQDTVSIITHGINAKLTSKNLNGSSTKPSTIARKPSQRLQKA